MNRREGWGGDIAAVGIAALLLAGCAGRPALRPEVEIRTVEVAVPVALGCVPANMAAPSAYPDTDPALRAAADAAERYQLLFAGRQLRNARLAEVEPVIAGCPKATAK